MKYLPSLFGAISSCFFVHAVYGQAYPVKPIRIVVAYAAGGPNDIMARAVGQKLAERVGQQVIVDNRPGAGSNIGSDHVAKSAPDGHTLLLGSPANAINGTLYNKMPYDPLNDLAAVTLLAVNPYLFVVHPSLPAKSVKDFIALARARPGQITYASSGAGGASHLTGELLKLSAKIDILHVPYKGGGPAMIDLAGGHVGAMFDNMITAVPYARTGKLRALAVTSLRRSEIMPEVPTVAEGGLSCFESLGWFSIFAPAATPRDIISRLNTEIAAVMRMPDMLERLKSQGVTAVGNSAAEFDKFFRDDAAKWAKVVKASGARAD
jgi:tripartite-type tricarboxylate transporter receptor subunit TctC